MGVWEAVVSGLSEILAHKLRSFLTMLGVIFGVAAVIAMVSIGEGARLEAMAQLKLLGVDVIRVERKSMAGLALEKAQEKSPYGLNYGDVVAIRQVLSYAVDVVPVRQVVAELQTVGTPVQAKVLGTAAGYRNVTRSELAAGRFLTQHDSISMASVCVLGSGVRRRLFGFENPVGRTVKLSGKVFTVVGSLAEKIVPSSTVVEIPDQDFDIYIPIEVAMKDFLIYSEQPVPTNANAVMQLLRAMTARQARDNTPLSGVVVLAGSEAAAPVTAEVINDILRRRHRNVDDYAIEIPSELIRQSQETQRVFNIVMGAIAGISLVVGGIGIMNIMLATVTQRTREIGIRRCVGATRPDIVRQFLLEALVITIFGGVLGVGLGVGGAQLIAQYAGWKTVVSVHAIALSLSVASGVGVIFGLYPAIRAAYVDPIAALRYE
ncbi:MAG: ABC transporter permease [Armatimonadetes bacterium]|nr:ABC transporter permease [Armatimonadota bacterium]